MDEIHTSTLTISPDRPGELVRCALEIEVKKGPDRGTRLRIDSGHAVIGGKDATDVDVLLSDSHVSRRHAELRAVADGVLLIDLGSKNGTRVGEVSIKEALLPADGCFQLGESELRVQQIREPVPLSAGAGQSFGRYHTANVLLAASLELLRRASKSAATVLLEGETGTGKELLARAVHDHSERKDKPFVVVDCGAVTASLLESQLFGHKKGAFTGAIADQVGAFEAAQGGTVFLDELGELPLDLQPKLLRAIEARTVRPVGDNVDRPIDVRFVAATHRDLTSWVKGGLFRQDLYFRVAVVRVRVPPMRERPEDVPLLAAHYTAEMSQERVSLSPAAIVTLCAYDWPGNARELRNVIERALAVTEKSQIEPADLFPDADSMPKSFHQAKEQLIGAFELRYVRALLERHEGNVSHAAKEAGLSRNALYQLMKRVGIE